MMQRQIKLKSGQTEMSVICKKSIISKISLWNKTNENLPSRSVFLLQKNKSEIIFDNALTWPLGHGLLYECNERAIIEYRYRAENSNNSILKPPLEPYWESTSIVDLPKIDDSNNFFTTHQ